MITQYNTSNNYTDFSVNNNGIITYNGSDLNGYEYTICVNPTTIAKDLVVTTMFTSKDNTYYLGDHFSQDSGCTYDFIYLNKGTQIIINPLSNTTFNTYTFNGTVNFRYKPSILFSYSNLYVAPNATVPIASFKNDITSPDFTTDAQGIITFKGSKAATYKYAVCNYVLPPALGTQQYMAYTITKNIISGSPPTLSMTNKMFLSYCSYEMITLQPGAQISIKIQNQSIYQNPTSPFAITCNGRVSFVPT